MKTSPLLSANFGPLSCFCLRTSKAEGDEFINTNAFPEVGTKIGSRGGVPQTVGDKAKPNAQPVPQQDDARPISPAKSNHLVEAGSSLIGAFVHAVEDKVDALVHPSAHGGALGSSGSKDEPWPLPLIQSLLSGKTVQAYRRLREMTDSDTIPPGLLQEDDIHRIRRIGESFEQAKANRKPEGAHEGRVENKEIEFSFYIRDGIVRLESSMVLRGYDTIHVLASLCELDCWFSRKDTKRSSPLHTTEGEEVQRADESLWRVVHDENREDNVVEVTCVNALDEEEDPMIWVSSRQVECHEAESKVNGVSIKPPQGGYHRVGTEARQYRITQLHEHHNESEDQGSVAEVTGSPSRAFRLTVIRNLELSLSARMLYCMMPRCFVLTSMRSDVISFYKDFVENLKRRGAELDEKISKGPRANFYAQVNRSLMVSCNPACCRLG